MAYAIITEKSLPGLVDRMNGVLYSRAIPKQGLVLGGQTLTFTSPAAGSVSFVASTPSGLLTRKEIVDQILAAGIVGLEFRNDAYDTHGQTGMRLALWADSSVVITNTPGAEILGWKGGATGTPVPEGNIVTAGNGPDGFFVLYTV